MKEGIRRQLQYHRLSADQRCRNWVEDARTDAYCEAYLDHLDRLESGEPKPGLHLSGVRNMKPHMEKLTRAAMERELAEYRSWQASTGKYMGTAPQQKRRQRRQEKFYAKRAARAAQKAAQKGTPKVTGVSAYNPFVVSVSSPLDHPSTPTHAAFSSYIPQTPQHLDHQPLHFLSFNLPSRANYPPMMYTHAS